MPYLNLPVSVDKIASLLASWRHNVDTDATWHLCFPSNIFISPRLLAMLTSWALEMQGRGVQFSVMADDETRRYLDRMEFQAIVGAQKLGVRKKVEAGRFIPLFLIDSGASQSKAVDTLCDVILRQFENARLLLPSFEWAVNEITDNILIHSQSKTPGVISAQFYPSRHELEIAVVDQGLGLLGTLGPSQQAKDERDAIQLALTRGVTRDSSVGQGNGLAGTELIIKRNAGSLRLWSCGSMVQVNAKARKFTAVPIVNGVGLALTFDVRNPIDLADTWLGQPSHTYIDREAEKLEDGGAVVHIVNECESVGSREPARRLRNKFMAMLPELSEQNIVFDFDRCRAPSSSFLDELFGRMALQMGLYAFQSRCSIRGLDGSLIDRANVVIDQRVRQGDNLPDWDDAD
jgi:anti-sigma regulatory factor (Ser/Thr protein kinase)